MKKILLILALSFISASFKSQVKTQFTLTLKDGSIVTGTVNVSKIDLVTDYGKLQIPIQNVSSIELGVHPDKSLSDKVKKLINQLANSNEQLRKSAYDELLNMDVGAIPLMDDMMFSTDYTPTEFTDYNLQNALSELKVKYNVSQNYKTKDVINIDYEYSIGGEYSFNNVQLKTDYGNLNIPRNTIKKIDILSFDENENKGFKVFKLFANTYISGNQNGGWLKTGIMVRKNQKINILATGQVKLESLSGNTYSPNGAYASKYDDKTIDNNSTSTYPSYGNVVYKIGESGKTIKAGDNYNALCDDQGMLYLSIYETVYNASNSGFYIVKVKTQ